MLLAGFSVHRWSLSQALVTAQVTALAGEYIYENFPALKYYLGLSTARQFVDFFAARDFNLIFFRLGAVSVFGMLANQANINLVYHMQVATAGTPPSQYFFKVRSL